MMEMEVQRATFEEMIGGVVARTIPRCWEGLARCFRRSGVTLQDVDHVLLVGGSTNIPMVQDVVTRHFCRSPGSDPPGMDDEAIISQVCDEDREVVKKLLARNERARCDRPYLDAPGTCVAMGAAIRAATAGTYLADDKQTVRVFFQGQAGIVMQG